MPRYTRGQSSYKDEFRHPKTYGRNPNLADFCPHLNENIMRALQPDSIATTYRENFIDYSGYYKRAPLAKAPENQFRLSAPMEWILPEDCLPDKKKDKEKKESPLKSVYSDDFAFRGPGDHYPIRIAGSSTDLSDQLPVESGRYTESVTRRDYPGYPAPGRPDPCSTCHQIPEPDLRPQGDPFPSPRDYPQEQFSQTREGVNRGNNSDDSRNAQAREINTSSNACTTSRSDDWPALLSRPKEKVPYLETILSYLARKRKENSTPTRSIETQVDLFQGPAPRSKHCACCDERLERRSRDPRDGDSFGNVQVAKSTGRRRSSRTEGTDTAAHPARHQADSLARGRDSLPEVTYGPEVAFQGRRRSGLPDSSCREDRNWNREDRNWNREDDGPEFIPVCSNCHLPIKPAGLSSEAFLAQLKARLESKPCVGCRQPLEILQDQLRGVGGPSKIASRDEAIRNAAEAIREAKASSDCYGVVETTIKGYYFCNHDQECCNPVRGAHATLRATEGKGSGGSSATGREKSSPKQDEFRTYNIACTRLPHMR